MKKSIFTLFVIAVVAIGCSPEDNGIESIEENIVVNLETFVPDASFDEAPQGKYVGVLGHHTNLDIHGKIYINTGQHDQYNALVKLVNGDGMHFKGIPRSRSGNLISFEGKAGSFIVDFTDYGQPISSEVILLGESTPGYVAVEKVSSRGGGFVTMGTYVDSSDPSFSGNWDLIGTSSTVIVPVMVDIPGIPFPVTLNIPTEQISSLVVSHTGAAAPFFDGDFETNTSSTCPGDALPGFVFPPEPLMISADIPNPLGGPALGGQGSISAGGQTSTFNGQEASWTLNFNTPIPAAMVPESYVNEDCSPATAGSWSWNGRSGTITVITL